MQLIDDEGNVFGRVNVIDGLVVLLVLAVVVAGVSLVFGNNEQSEPDLPTTNVTLDLGPQPDYVVAEMNQGDSYSPGDNSNLTITDIYLSPQDDQTHVTVRAEIQDRPDDNSDGPTYADGLLRLGRTLDIATSRYEVSGQIRAIGGGTSLDRETTTVVVQDTVPATDARAITTGDEIRLAGRTIATVTDVAAYPTNKSAQRTVYVEAELETYAQRGERRFGNTQLRRGQTVTLPASEYTIDGRLERVGGGLDRGEVDVLVESTVDVETANRIAEGDIATVAGHETAEVQRVTTYATGNPDKAHVFVGITLQTLSDDQYQQFGSTHVQRGNNVEIETESYALSGPIRRVGALEERGTLSNRTVTLRMTDIREDTTDAIDVGMTEHSGGTTVARVTRVDIDPAVIIATDDSGSVNVVDHPFLRDVTLTTELRVRETTSGVRFKGDTIRQDSTVVLDLGTITVRTEVASIGG
ncbi:MULTISPECIES: DUF4330 family protein [Halomicrobium]|uniref:DUF4330 family protein n=2 Tax=Halomicrobium mukohataei TaxID=57705 RepID=C7P3C3_HALMD|nr:MULTISPECIES: DUF4330 family protein [Halomicrobium]ACV47595.1 conserved hypothetical protein [Halomicrobium mukohataei DSM 12286]QCD66057.1 DUF4330 family protein [Halomicrobium mukohataei]QFR20862.1 DUF4330 family protein [Halomicrobium sp. ZPS1]